MSDASCPSDWAAHYAAGDIPWDLGRAHPELARRLGSGELAPPRPGARALVAGCGTGHDPEALARAGWVVTAVDLVAQLEGPLRERLGPLGGQVVIGDALRLDGADLGEPFDLVWEHTFLCAIEPDLRADWGAAMGRFVRPDGGLLAGVCYPMDKPLAEGGPPFGWNPAEVLELLGPGFRKDLDEPAEAGGEHRTWPARYLRLVREEA